jgi:hypothetical protein
MRPSRGKGGRVRRAVVLGDELSSMGSMGIHATRLLAPFRLLVVSTLANLTSRPIDSKRLWHLLQRALPLMLRIHPNRRAEMASTNHASRYVGA